MSFSNPDEQLSYEAGILAGLRGQKLEDLHEDIRNIRDRMALQAEIVEMRGELRELLTNLTNISVATKKLILDRLDQVSRASGDTTDTGETVSRDDSIQGRDVSSRTPLSSLEQLSPRERKVLDLLLESGALTYMEIGERLEVTPMYAKTLVNRILRKADILDKKSERDQRRLVSVKDGFRSQFRPEHSECSQE